MTEGFLLQSFFQGPAEVLHYRKPLQHIKKGKPFSNLLAKHEGLTRNQARALEQYYIENGPHELNKINSISPNNRNYQQAMNWAKDYIDSH